MTLAPLANVVAYLDRDPARLAGIQQALGGGFDAVWSPVEGCVMATRALPRSAPDGEEVRTAGIAFAEGRAMVSGHSCLSLESLPGDVGFVRATGNHLVVARSGPGTVPWYAWQDGERALVATTFTDLVRLLPIIPEFDLLVCALWADLWGTFPDGRSFLRGVTAIPPGHTAEVGPGHAVRCHPWWNPWPDELPFPSRASRADHVERFREAVIAALGRDVAEEPVNLLTLSGGVDSSTLAYLVRRHLGRPLAALSFVPPEGCSEAALEASYLDPLIAELGIAPHQRWPLNSAQRVALAAETPLVVFPVVHPALHLLPHVVEEWGIEVLLGGEWADEVCGGWFAYPDWLDAVSLPRLFLRPATTEVRRDLRAWARRRRPGRPRPGPWPTALSDWVHPEVDAEYQAWRVAQLNELEACATPHRYQRALASCVDGVLAMNWEVCSFLGVRRSFPFRTAQVLEVVSACHPTELLGPGPKRLERQAFAELVPARYLQRPDKSGWRGDSDETPLEPPAMSPSLAGMFREDMKPMDPTHRTGLAILSRFANRLGPAAGAATGRIARS